MGKEWGLEVWATLIAEAKLGFLYLGHVEGADTCSWAKMHSGIWIHSHYSNVPAARVLVTGTECLWTGLGMFPYVNYHLDRDIIC